jgi:hypothetical protein
MKTILGMTFELKRISHSERLSEETNAYAADLWVDGKLLAHVKNDGHGGCDMTYPAKGRTAAEIDALDKRLKAEGPKRTAQLTETETFEIECDIESICSELLADHLIAKDVKRSLKSRVMWVNEKGELMQSKKLKPEQMVPALAAFKQKYPAFSFVNEMPLDKQIEAFRNA